MVDSQCGREGPTRGDERAVGGADDRLRALYSELVESETRFRTMADHAPVLLWMAGTDSLCNFFNQQWLNFTGRTMQEECGTGWAEGVHAEDFQSCMHEYLDAFVARESFRMEYRLRRADGQYRWVLDQGLPRYAPGGAFAGYIGSCVDITDLRETAEAQRRITEQLEVLVQELHHRVKNNLQVIISLLNLQVRLLDDPKVIDLFRETQGRVRAIALLHEQLHQSNDLTQIRADDYFGGLLSSLRMAFGASAREANVSLDAQGVMLEIDTTIPCGLIVNELVTNAFKHAFVDWAGTPTIQVGLSRSASGALELVVADNGVGAPANLDPDHPTSLGLQLVRNLARQVGAELALSRDQGTRWTLTIPGP